jgi:hypothetical protein
MIDADADGSLELAEGDDSVGLELEDVADPTGLALPRLHAFPRVEVDVAAGELAFPVGALDRHAAEITAAAEVFGGRSVLTVAFETSDPEAPLFIAARGGEPVVLALGDEQFELGGP